MSGDFIPKQYSCGLCSKQFSSYVVKKTQQPVVKTDTDFCMHYARETPYFYHVFVCPACGYAFMESFKKKPFEKMREKITPLPDFFSEKRDPATAQLAYKRATECALLQREDEMIMASLYLQMSWIMRVKGDKVGEMEAQRKALASYTGVYENSQLQDASKVMYLIGELNRRLGNRAEAVNWYSRVANDKKCNQAMRTMARDGWQSLRE